MRRKKSRRRSNSKKFGNLWLVTAVLVILFIAGLYYLQDHSHRRIEPEHHLLKEKAQKSETKLKAEPQKTESVAPTSSQPQFDFYNMLSHPQNAKNPANNTTTTGNSNHNQAIPAPNAPVKGAKPSSKLQVPAPTQKTTENKPATTPATQYVLQVASLRDYKKVDEIKAELAINGFNVTTEKIKKGDVIEYRINVGPYHSLKAAEADQRRLRANNMNGLLVKTK